MISFSKFLAEALPLSKAKSFRNIAKRNQSDYKNKGRRVLLDYKFSHIADSEFIEGAFNRFKILFYTSKQALADAGYTMSEERPHRDSEVINFLKGRCFVKKKDSYDYKNHTSIAKVLKKIGAEVLYSAYITDKSRSEFALLSKDREKGVQHKIVISSLYLDVAGMSTDKKWKSCMALKNAGIRSGRIEYEDGIHADKLEADIRLGTLVAYLIRTPYKSLDAAIDDAIARIAIRLHFDADNEGSLCFVPGDTYGLKITEFAKAVKDFADSKNLSKNFIVNDDLYDELGDSEYTKIDPEIRFRKSLDAALENPSDENVQKLVEFLKLKEAGYGLLFRNSRFETDAYVKLAEKLFGKISVEQMRSFVRQMCIALEESRKYKPFAELIRPNKEKWKKFFADEPRIILGIGSYVNRGILYAYAALDTLYPGTIDDLLLYVAETFRGISHHVVRGIVEDLEFFDIIDKEKFKKDVIPALKKDFNDDLVDRTYRSFLED